ncbi:hypothetical protein KN825_15235, partial [Weizmannia coagulans]|nr:hypothetical protein [Heyndrickxia coagulans]
RRQDDKKLNTSHSYYFLNMKKKKMKNEKKGRLIQNPNYDIPSLPLHTSERTLLIVIERNALSHLLNPKCLGRGKVPFFWYSREQIQRRRGGACSSED